MSLTSFQKPRDKYLLGRCEIKKSATFTTGILQVGLPWRLFPELHSQSLHRVQSSGKDHTYSSVLPYVINTRRNRGCLGCWRGTWQQMEKEAAKPKGKDTHSWRLLGWSREACLSVAGKNTKNAGEASPRMTHERDRHKNASRSNFYTFKTRKAGSTYRHRDREAGQLPSIHQSNAEHEEERFRPGSFSQTPEETPPSDSLLLSDFALWGGQQM